MVRFEKTGRNGARRWKKIAAAAAVCSLLFAVPAHAEWQNESAGPGAAVWVGEQQPDGTVSEQPAPDAQDQFISPDDHSTTYINGQPVSLTAPDGQRQAVEQAPGEAAGDAQAQAAGEQNEAAAPGQQTTSDGAGQPNAEQTPDGNSAQNTAAQPETGAEQTAGTPETGNVQPDAAQPQEGTQNQPETAQPQPEQTQQSAGQQEAAQAQDPNLVASGGRIVDLRKPMIALTYDDGPYAPVGNRIMDTLETYNGRATFFMVGDRVPSYATEVRRMASNGHEVANHTYNHKYLNKLDAASIRAQVTKANDVIESVSGQRPKLMRLPGGNKNATVLQNVNMPIILWNIDTRDWATKNAQKTIDAVVGKVKDGDIILMHELYSSTADATAAIVPKLAAQGYQFVTVSELAKFKGKSLGDNQIYYAIR